MAYLRGHRDGDAPGAVYWGGGGDDDEVEADWRALELGGGLEHELCGMLSRAGELVKERRTSVALLMMREVILLSGVKLNLSSGSWLYCRGGGEWIEVGSSPTGAVVSQSTGICVGDEGGGGGGGGGDVRG